MLRGTMLLLLLVASPAVAQDVPIVDQPRCWAGGLSFTEGATFAAGESPMTCQADASWSEAEGSSLGCAYEGKINSVGAVVGVSNNKAFSLECLEDGTWSRVPLAPE